MKKIFALGLAIVAGIGIVSPASAAEENSIVIIDSGFSTQDISNNVLLEVCITTTRGCNNGQNMQFGAGAAGSTVNISSRFSSDWSHGTEMARQAIAVNPDVKIIVIRNSRVFSNGAILPGGESSVQAALSWVSENASRYNISAVALSRGDNKYFVSDRAVSGLQAAYQRYVKQLSGTGLSSRSVARITNEMNKNRDAMAALPDKTCPASSEIRGLVSQLARNNVATLFATGNDFNNKFVDSPACIDQAVAVAASDASGRILPMSNVASNTDFAVEAPNTSTATARLAGYWASVFDGSFDSTYNYVLSVSSDVSGFAVRAVDVLK